MLKTKLLPLQTRLRAWAVSERTREGLLRSGHWGDPPPIRWQDVNPNPVHTKTCGEVVTGKIKMALTLPEVLVYVLPQVGGPQDEGRTVTPAALQPSVTNPPTPAFSLPAYPPARPLLWSLPRWPSLHSSRPEARRLSHAAPLQRRAPPPRPGTPPLSLAASELKAPAQAPTPSSCERHLVLRLPARENLAPESPTIRMTLTLQETMYRAELIERASSSLTAKEKSPARRHLTSPPRCAAQLALWLLRLHGTLPCGS